LAKPGRLCRSRSVAGSSRGHTQFPSRSDAVRLGFAWDTPRQRHMTASVCCREGDIASRRQNTPSETRSVENRQFSVTRRQRRGRTMEAGN
jgi:hypothetical protein